MGISIILVMHIGLIILFDHVNLVCLELRSNPTIGLVLDPSKVDFFPPRIVPVGQEFGSCNLPDGV